MSFKSLLVLFVVFCMQNHGISTDDTKPDPSTTRGYTLPKFKNRHYWDTEEARYVGNAVVFRCDAKGNRTPNITWYMNGKSPVTRAQGTVEFKRWSITLEDLMVEDSGEYTCRVCNAMGCINRTSNLIVKESFTTNPLITKSLKNQTVEIGENVKMECNATSDLRVRLQWGFSPSLNNPLDYFRTINRGNTDDYPVYEFKARSEDAAWYYCIFSTVWGRSITKAYLTVKAS